MPALRGLLLGNQERKNIKHLDLVANWVALVKMLIVFSEHNYGFKF